MSKYVEVAKAIIENVGGTENMTSVMHCSTRIRIRVKNDSNVNVDAIKAIDGVLGYVSTGGQHQIIIGARVKDVHREVVNLSGVKDGGYVEADEDDAKVVKQSVGTKILDAFSGIFVPIIPALTGAGLLQALLTVLVQFGVMDGSTVTYQVLVAFSKASYYFLPLIIANSAAKKFNCNQYVAMAIAGALLHPNFTGVLSAAAAEGAAATFLGLAIPNVNYSSTVFPALLAVWIMSYVEKGVTKVIPSYLQTVFTPLAVMLIMIPITILGVGPLGNYLGQILLVIIQALSGVAPWLVPVLVGLICPFVVMTGMHFASFIPMTVQLLASNGMDPIIGIGMISSNFALAGVAIAFAIVAKKAANKELGFSVGVQSVFGIAEPGLFGVCIPYKTPMIATCIGGAAGGLVGGILGATRYAQAGNSIFSLTSYIGGASMNSFYFAIVAVAVAFVAGFVAMFVLKVKEQ